MADEEERLCGSASGMIDGENFTMQATLSTQTQSAHWLFAVGDGMGNWNDKNVGDYIL